MIVCTRFVAFSEPHFSCATSISLSFFLAFIYRREFNAILNLQTFQVTPVHSHTPSSIYQIGLGCIRYFLPYLFADFTTKVFVYKLYEAYLITSSCMQLTVTLAVIVFLETSTDDCLLQE